MTTIVFMLIEVQTGKIANVLDAIEKIPNVEECYAITGPFDVHAKIKAKDIEEVKEIIEQVQKIDGVEKTLSSMVLPY
jgi:DNA-binding Lrp family transcriptional regulator